MTKFTNFIETEEGGIDPKNCAPFEIAMRRFDHALSHVRKMEDAPDRANYEASWNEFVLQLEASWKAFIYDGEKVSTKFQPWAGPYVRCRRKDELLSYLSQSRHTAMHKLINLDWETPKNHAGAKIEGTFYIRDYHWCRAWPDTGTGTDGFHP